MISIHNVSQYCSDYQKIENYEKAIDDTSQVWDCHHRLETHFSDGTERPKDAQISMDELKALDMYYNRPANELIFLKPEEHTSLTFKGQMPWCKGKHLPEEMKNKISKTLKGHHPTDETRKKLSESLKGENNPMYGKHHSEEAKRKVSEANKGNRYWEGKHHSEESKKKMAESHKGKPTWMKGKHHSEKSKRKMSEAAKLSEARKGRYWFNNGIKNVLSKTCPEGFVPGRLLNKSKQ